MRFQLGERVRLRGRGDVGIGQVIATRRNGQIQIQWLRGVFPIRRWASAEELEAVGNEPLHPGEK